MTQPCDCGHEFERDPRWFHLSSCAYRQSFGDLKDVSLFPHGGLCDGAVHRLGPGYAKYLHQAYDRRQRELRKAAGIAAMRAAYRRKKR